MNGEPRRGPDDASQGADAAETGSRRDPVDRDAADDGARDHAMPLPATSADERHAAEPVDSDESVAGEEDPGAAVDEGAGESPRGSRSEP